MPKIWIEPDTERMLRACCRYFHVETDAFLHENLSDRLKDEPALLALYLQIQREELE